jgi:AcrR family transcriptional regulator
MSNDTAPGPIGSGVSLRESRRLQRIQTSREQILDIAEEMFSERGYAKTSLKEIAERSEFSVGAIYTFFESKSHLLHAVLRRRSEVELQLMADLAASDAEPDDLLMALAQLEIEYFRQHRNWARMMVGFLVPGGAEDTGSIGSWFSTGYGRAMDIQADVISRGQRAGVLREGNPHALARLFAALVISFHQMDAELGPTPFDFGLTQFLDFIRSTFLLRPATVDAVGAVGIVGRMADADEFRVAERSHLLPEEVAVGSDDAVEQAKILLEDSDERTAHPEQARHESSQTPD